jgi:hypothetical protein
MFELRHATCYESVFRQTTGRYALPTFLFFR